MSAGSGMRLMVEHLAQERGGRRVLDNISFTVPSGRALLLRGANGAGKSTLLRTLAGFMAPSAGNIRLDGVPTGTEVGERAHYVGHTNSIKVRLTVEENLAFWSTYLGGTAGDMTKRALAAFDLEALATVPAGYLSAGQKRRLGLARLLAVERPLWLLDEPTASLDQRQHERVTAIMREHLGKGGLIVAATHVPLELDDALHLELGAPAVTGG